MTPAQAIVMFYGRRQDSYYSEEFHDSGEFHKVNLDASRPNHRLCCGCIEGLPYSSFYTIKGSVSSRCKDCTAGRGPEERLERKAKTARETTFVPRSSKTVQELRNRANCSASCAAGRSRHHGRSVFGGLSKVEAIEATLQIFDDAYFREETTGEPHDVDHLVELADGGLHHPSNLWAIPRSLHQRKTRQSIKARTHIYPISEGLRSSTPLLI